LLSGAGSINIDQSSVFYSANNQIVILTTNSEGDFIWVNSFSYPDNTTTEGLSIAYGLEGYLFAGITFEGQISIQEDTFISSGGKDILLLKFDETGNLIEYKQYGTNEDESVFKIFYQDSILYLGGEFSGINQITNIGMHQFVNLSDNDNNAYISYVLETNFESSSYSKGAQSRSNSEVTSLNRNYHITNNNIKVYPNPFENILFVEIESLEPLSYNFQLYNTLGNSVWRNTVRNEFNKYFHFNIDFDNEIPPGIYYLEVINENGENWNYKIVKK
jgi:type IX secretion system substrate protein